jgi:hypothetical protein
MIRQLVIAIIILTFLAAGDIYSFRTLNKRKDNNLRFLWLPGAASAQYFIKEARKGWHEGIGR